MSLSYLPDLSPSIFAHLADGLGDARAMDDLDAAQYSVNVARLELLRRIAIERFPDHCADVDLAGAWALLAAAESTDPESVRVVFKVPAVGSWIAQSLVASLAPADAPAIRRHLSYAWAVAAAAAVRSKMDFECPVPVYDNAIFLPSVGAYPWPMAAEESSAMLRHHSAGVTLDGVAIGPAAGPTWLTNRVLATVHDGLAIRVPLDDLDPYRSSGGLNAAARVADEELATLQSQLTAAWSILVERHRSYAEGIAQSLRSLVLLAGYPANRGVSAALRDSHGSVCLTMPTDATSFAVTLVHESQHLKLNRILERVSLHTGESDRSWRAPWRDDPRPLEGLMHGAYAFAAVTEFWRTERAVASGSAWAVAEFEFARWRAGVAEALSTILQSGDLTEAGAFFFARLSDRVTPWLDDKVDDAVRAVVEESILDDEVSWRLRNSQVDPGLAQDLARRYREGVSATGVPRSFAVRIGGPGREDHSRQDLARLGLVDPARFERLTSDPETLAAEAPRATVADVAYALGSDDAEHLHRALVGADHSNLDAWVGLAMSLHRQGRTALVDQIELSFAVHHELSALGTPVDPDRIAQWLSEDA